MLTACGVIGLAAGVVSLGGSPGVATLLALLAAIPASDLAVGVVNFIVTSTIRPQILPKLDFSKGIPADHHTLVVMPTMLTSEKSVRSLLERLEIQYLANPESGLSFALLTDFDDADQEHSPEDEALLTLAHQGIAALNAQYSDDENARFYLLHRRRQRNANANSWMGWERKRGKLRRAESFFARRARHQLFGR